MPATLCEAPCCMPKPQLMLGTDHACLVLVLPVRCAVDRGGTKHTEPVNFCCLGNEVVLHGSCASAAWQLCQCSLHARRG
jgi:hypothetical protein